MNPLTKREMIAAMFVQGFFSNPSITSYVGCLNDACQAADSLLLELAKTEEKPKEEGRVMYLSDRELDLMRVGYGILALPSKDNNFKHPVRITIL